jgi:hypothetical protein
MAANRPEVVDVASLNGALVRLLEPKLLALKPLEIAEFGKNHFSGVSGRHGS